VATQSATQNRSGALTSFFSDGSGEEKRGQATFWKREAFQIKIKAARNGRFSLMGMVSDVESRNKPEQR